MKIASLSSYSGINFKRFVVVVVVVVVIILITTTTIRMTIIIIIKSLATDCTKLTSGCILCVT